MKQRSVGKHDLGSSRNFKSKYRKFLALGIIGLFLLIPLSIPYWNLNGFVGVSNGNSFTWDRYYNSSVYDKYIFDVNDSSAESAFPDFVKSNNKIRVKIDEVQNEHMYDIDDVYTNVTYENLIGRNIQCDRWVQDKIGIEGIPDPWIEVSSLDILVLENDPEIYSTILLFGNLFIATDVDFAIVADIIENTQEDLFGNSVQVIHYGKNDIRIHFYPSYEQEYGNFTTITSFYTKHGVLQEYTFEYGFEILFSIKLVTDTRMITEIVMLAISIGVGISSMGCIIYYIKNKEKNLRYNSSPILREGF